MWVCPPFPVFVFPVYFSFLSGITAYPRDSCLQERVRHSLRESLMKCLWCIIESQNYGSSFFCVCRSVASIRASRLALVVKTPSANAGDIRDTGSIPGSERSPGEGNDNPLQYSCLENPMDRGAWWAIVQEVAKSWA